MNRRIVRNLLNVLQESSLYCTMSLEERYDLMNYFLSMYSSGVEPCIDTEGEGETDPDTPPG